jgi:signal transduction histidine kinase/PAS domain-containing protein/ActR/RegA family two-component response regulator
MREFPGVHHLGFGVALVVVLVFGANAALELGAIDARQASRRAARERVLALDAVLENVLDVESSSRAFAAVGEPADLVPFERGVARVPEVLAEMRRTFAADPEHGADVERLTRRVADREAASRGIVAAVRGGGPDAGRAMIATGEGRRLMDALRTDLSALRAGQFAHIQAVDDDARQRAGRVAAWMLGTAVLALAFLVVIWILLAREMSRRARAEATARALAEHYRDDAVQAREALAVRLQLALDAADLGWWRYDPATRYSWWDRRYRQIFGVEGFEQPNDEILKRLHPDDLPGVWAKVEAALDPVNPQPYATEYRVVRPDGVVWVEARGVVTFAGEGSSRKAVDFVGTVADITGRKLGEQRIQRQLARTSLLNRVTRAIAERQDLDSLFRVVLASVEADLPAEAAWILMPSPDRARVRAVSAGLKAEALEARDGLDRQTWWPVGANGVQACLSACTASEPDLREASSPLLRKLADSGLRSVVCAPLANGDAVDGVLLVARGEAHGLESGDAEFVRQLAEHVALSMAQHRLIRDLRSANERLTSSQQSAMQQERLRAMGQMASGIAHDINNALGPIVLYSEAMLEDEPGLAPNVRKAFSTIQTSADSVAKTVARLRQFYRKADDEALMVPVDVNQFVTEAIDLTRPRWHDIPLARGVVIAVTTDLDDARPVLACHDAELREALTNLIFNAVDALPLGGAITLRTRRAENGEGSAIHVEVADDGVGMDEDTRNRCLEPFFTTKGERGTGLGLAMVFGAVQRHGGRVDVQSAPGAGTTVRLVFPCRAPAQAAAPVALVRVASLRILSIDDDPALRTSLADVLAADGHQVRTAESGSTGLEMFRQALQDRAPFDVVVTDLGMPGMDGRQVALAIKQASPSTPVILLTGWGAGMREGGEVPEGVDRVAAKPPRVAELRRLLAELCGAAPEA